MGYRSSLNRGGGNGYTRLQTKQRFVRYLGAGSYRRFAGKRASERERDREKVLFVLLAVGAVLLALWGMWQETRGLLNP